VGKGEKAVATPGHFEKSDRKFSRDFFPARRRWGHLAVAPTHKSRFRESLLARSLIEPLLLACRRAQARTARVGALTHLPAYSAHCTAHNCKYPNWHF
jgi:hypothetical protein